MSTVMWDFYERYPVSLMFCTCLGIVVGRIMNPIMIASQMRYVTKKMATLDFPSRDFVASKLADFITSAGID
jgi:hypothetical protein